MTVDNVIHDESFDDQKNRTVQYLLTKMHEYDVQREAVIGVRFPEGDVLTYVVRRRKK